MSRRGVAVVGALALAVVAVPPPAQAAPNVIVAVSGVYAPAELVVPAGTGLTLVNLDESSHDVVAVEGQFASATIGRGTAKVLGVESLAPNTYSFYCTVHPDDMWGNLTVV